MKKLVLFVLIAVALAGCDSPADKTETEAEAAPAEQKAEVEKAEAEKAEEEEAAPAEQAETAPAKPQLADDIEAGETRLYGSRFTVIEPPVTLTSAIEKAAEHPGPYKIEGEVEKVCKKKGCWFTLADEQAERPVRVRMKNYGFFVPRNADGAKVVVEGTLDKKTIPQDVAQHYADDAAEAGEKAEKVDGPQEVYELTATSVEITQS